MSEAPQRTTLAWSLRFAKMPASERRARLSLASPRSAGIRTNWAISTASAVQERSLRPLSWRSEAGGTPQCLSWCAGWPRNARLARGTDRFAAALTARWGARLSALLIRGNAVVHRACWAALGVAPRPWSGEAGPLPHSLPEGECNYELLCLRRQ